VCGVKELVLVKPKHEKVDPFAPVGEPGIETLRSAHDRIPETERRRKK
jgi:hypothetical protein